jgi:signal transduction histidine kinase
MNSFVNLTSNSSAKPLPKPLAILCVDDEAIVLDSLKEQLKRRFPNCAIEIAESGEEALTILQELQAENYDLALVISDQLMPGMKGDQLLRQVHQQAPQVLTVLLTGQASSEAIGNAVNGANLYRYIAKPWDETDLGLTVLEALRRYSQDVQLTAQNAELQSLNQNLAALNAGLEQKVADRTTDLVTLNGQLHQAKEAAEAANLTKSRFLAQMSHELRTPLSAILGFSELLRGAELAPEHQDMVGIINRSGSHLLNLINDVLELSKIEAGKLSLDLEPCDLPALLQDVQSMFQLKAQAKHLQLSLEIAPQLPLYIQTDVSKLRQILINLVGNAVKFTQQGQVVVRCQPGPARPEPPENRQRLQVDVIDSGPGIATNELDQVFEAFVQTETGRQSRKGTGLGLSICRELAVFLGGELTVASQVGQGSCFRCILPVVALSAVPTAPVSQTILGLAAGQPAYRLLVAEDAPDSRRFLVQLLTHLGFVVEAVADGRAAIAAYQTGQPQLILMDLQMPDIGGAQAAAQIRQLETDQQRRRIPIIALSASLFGEEERAVLNHGFDDFLRKPFASEALLATLAKHLPVRYRYAAAESVPASVLDLPKAVAALPIGWRQQFYAAAEDLNGAPCLALLSQLPADQSPLAEALRHLVEDFQFDVLIALLAPE